MLASAAGALPDPPIAPALSNCPYVWHALFRRRQGGRALPAETGRDGAYSEGDESTPHPRRIPHHRRARGHVAGHHAAGADDGVVADGDAGQDQGAGADPDIGADADRAAAFEHLPAQGRVAGMVGGEDLYPGADLRAVADPHRDHVEDAAVEIHEHGLAQVDVEAVIAVEGRADVAALPDGAEPLLQQALALGRVLRQGRVVAGEPGHGPGGIGGDLGIVGDVESAGEHLLLLRTGVQRALLLRLGR